VLTQCSHSIHGKRLTAWWSVSRNKSTKTINIRINSWKYGTMQVLLLEKFQSFNWRWLWTLSFIESIRNQFWMDIQSWGFVLFIYRWQSIQIRILSEANQRLFQGWIWHFNGIVDKFNQNAEMFLKSTNVTYLWKFVSCWEILPGFFIYFEIKLLF